MRVMRVVPLILVAAGLGIIAWGTLNRAKQPPEVLSTGAFEFTDKLGTKLVFAKREISVGGMRVSEVQLPGGTWIDCRQDCAEAIRNEYSEVWDRLQQRR